MLFRERRNTPTVSGGPSECLASADTAKLAAYFTGLVLAVAVYTAARALPALL